MNRVLIYTFPFFLVVMEWLLRISLRVNSQEFVAPTVAAAGLGLLIPLTGRKNRRSELSAMTIAMLDAMKMEVPMPRRERILIDVVWIAVLVSVFIWASCLVFACRPEQNPF